MPLRHCMLMCLLLYMWLGKETCTGGRGAVWRGDGLYSRLQRGSRGLSLSWAGAGRSLHSSGTLRLATVCGAPTRSSSSVCLAQAATTPRLAWQPSCGSLKLPAGLTAAGLLCEPAPCGLPGASAWTALAMSRHRTAEQATGPSLLRGRGHRQVHTAPGIGPVSSHKQLPQADA